MAATRWSTRYELLQAAFAIPVAIVVGLAAIALARRGSAHGERTLRRAPGGRAATIGRRLGVAGVPVATTAAGAAAGYGLLAYVSN